MGEPAFLSEEVPTGRGRGAGGAGCTAEVWSSPLPPPRAVSEQSGARPGDRGVLRLWQEWGPVGAAGEGRSGGASWRSPGQAADPCLSFQKSIRPQVVTTFELPGCYDMWTVIAPVRKEQVRAARLATYSQRCWPAPGLWRAPMAAGPGTRLCAAQVVWAGLGIPALFCLHRRRPSRGRARSQSLVPPKPRMTGGDTGSSFSAGKTLPW